jgi:hypothetical protein
MFIDFEYVKEFFKNKRVCLIGSGPSCFSNQGSVIDGYDIIVRVNNYVYEGHNRQLGHRTDVHYAFYGSSIQKTKEQLQNHGVKLCMCKCPNDKPFHSEWHIKNNKPYGVDFRYIYKKRACFWFCPTFIPTTEHFLKTFNMLGKHIPTTGFSAICDLKKTSLKELYITGYDFFKSKQHNGHQAWRDKNPDDPFKHMPNVEAQFVKSFDQKDDRIILDRTMKEILYR